MHLTVVNVLRWTDLNELFTWVGNLLHVQTSRALPGASERAAPGGERRASSLDRGAPTTDVKGFDMAWPDSISCISFFPSLVYILHFLLFFSYLFPSFLSVRRREGSRQRKRGEGEKNVKSWKPFLLLSLFLHVAEVSLSLSNCSWRTLRQGSPPSAPLSARVY